MTIENGMLVGADAVLAAEADLAEHAEVAIEVAFTKLQNEFIQACEAGDFNAQISIPHVARDGSYGVRSKTRLADALMCDGATCTDLLTVLAAALKSHDAGVRIVAQALVVSAANRHGSLHCEAQAWLDGSRL